MFRYKIDILKSLKECGYTTYRIRQEKLLGENVLTYIRKGEIVAIKSLDTICTLLNCDIGDVIEHIKE